MNKTLSPPLVLEVSLGAHANRIMRAGERSGAAVERSKHLRFWQSRNEHSELAAAWEDYGIAFGAMFAFHKEAIEAAYYQGVQDGKERTDAPRG